MPRRRSLTSPLRSRARKGVPARRRTRSSVRRAPARRANRSTQAAASGAQRQLKAFRQASVVAVAFTALLLLLVPDAAPAQEGAPVDAVAADSAVAAAEAVPLDSTPGLRPDSLVHQTGAEASGAIRRLWLGFVRVLPKLLVVGFLLLFAWLLVRLLRPVVRRLTGRLQRGEAYTALWGIAVWLLAVGVAVSVLAGDIRALVGSLGLLGLALSWSLQTPIESFTGWLLNSFEGYYRVGDRVAVGDVRGDVYRIDFLTTTVWEIGGPDSPSGIQAEQPTGRLITFPNSEVLAGSIVNYTRDFPYVWDEVAVSVASESDLAYAAEVAERVAVREVGEGMAGPAKEYARVLAGTPLDAQIADTPEVYALLTDWGVNLTVRYLAAVRAKRATKSRLGQALLAELSRPEHSGKILPAYPREQVQLVDPHGRAQRWPGAPASPSDEGR